MYFSGIITIAETVQHTAVTKREILKKYLVMTPIERVKEICGENANKCFAQYDEFLGKLCESEFRELLRRTTADRKSHTPEFRDIKNKGHHFSMELVNLLEKTYPSSHPIHLALRV